MKKYFKIEVNTKTKKKEKIKGIEYSFEDFEKGVLLDRWIKPGETLWTDGKTNHCNYLPETEFKKIREKQKEYYLEKVEKKFQFHKSSFESMRLKSGNVETLLQTEIDKCKNLLIPAKKSLEPISRENPTIYDTPMQKLYQQIIVEGKQNFNLTNSPKCCNGSNRDRGFIQVEGLNNYYNWLIIQKGEYQSRQLPSGKESTKSTKTNSEGEDCTHQTFTDCLKSDYEYLLPALIIKYKDKKPKEKVLMVAALYKLDILDNSYRNKYASTHRCITASFGKSGSVKYYTAQVKIMDSNNADDLTSIETHKKIITKIISSNKS